jgi:hypothetical protein
LAGSTAATGEALTEAQIAKQLADGGGFTQRVAQLIRNSRSLDALGGAGRGAVARLLSRGVRDVLRHGAGRAAGGFSLLSWPALATLTLILLASGGGVYLYRNWGKPSTEPVQPGPAMTRQRPVSAPSTAAISPGELQLVSSTSDPPTAEPYEPYWKIDKDAGTTSYVYEELTANYFWTVPQSIPKSGADISIRGEATAVEGNRLNATIAVSASGLTLDPEKPFISVTAEGAQSAGRKEVVKVTDPSDSGDATISVYVGYTFRFDYVYRRAP